MNHECMIHQRKNFPKTQMIAVNRSKERNRHRTRDFPPRRKSRRQCRVPAERRTLAIILIIQSWLDAWYSIARVQMNVGPKGPEHEALALVSSADNAQSHGTNPELCTNACSFNCKTRVRGAAAERLPVCGSVPSLPPARFLSE